MDAFVLLLGGVSSYTLVRAFFNKQQSHAKSFFPENIGVASHNLRKEIQVFPWPKRILRNLLLKLRPFLMELLEHIGDHIHPLADSDQKGGLG